jgi:hypothetical protein
MERDERAREKKDRGRGKFAQKEMDTQKKIEM